MDEIVKTKTKVKKTKSKKSSYLLMTSLRKPKRTPGNGRKYSKYIYLTKDLHLANMKKHSMSMLRQATQLKMNKKFDQTFDERRDTYG